MVVAKRGVRGQVEKDYATGQEYLRKDAPTPTAVLEPKRTEHDAESNTNRNATKFTDPTIVEGLL